MKTNKKTGCWSKVSKVKRTEDEVQKAMRIISCRSWKAAMGISSFTLSEVGATGGF